MSSRERNFEERSLRPVPICTIPMKSAERILGATHYRGQLVYLIKWRGTEESDFILSEEANLKWPQIVIKFHEDKFKFNQPLEI